MTRVILAILAILALVGCAEPRPPTGSAQSIAAGEQARVLNLQAAADKAALDAATSAAKAKELADTVAVLKTQASTDASSKAKLQETVEQAQAAKTKADVDAAVNSKIQDILAKAVKERDDAARKADVERNADLAASEQRHFRFLCQLVGMIVIAVCCIAGGVLVYIGMHDGRGPKAGLYVAIVGVATGVVVSIYAAAQPWLLGIAALVGAGSLVVWGLRHLHLSLDSTLAKVEVETGPVVTSVESAVKAEIAALGAKLKEIDGRFTVR